MVGAAVGGHAVGVVQAGVVVDCPFGDRVEVLFENGAQRADAGLASGAVGVDGEGQLVREQILGQGGLRLAGVDGRGPQGLMGKGV
ncbi:hypothetical protein GCM10020358_52760 [Amorphoplanes nipponensis]|uniref:Uncharacterized protein n=1 Tax=Actinoplanes nipponensis TaxID=135950 RepID=A0A919JMN7_9ACTN|nr:hypothetical protein Ani05nite_31180 [Actinoplanes nipponensis]